jgi:hypothetical protein
LIRVFDETEAKSSLSELTQFAPCPFLFRVLQSFIATGSCCCVVWGLRSLKAAFHCWSCFFIFYLSRTCARTWHSRIKCLTVKFSIKRSLQFSCNFVVINASEGSLCFEIFLLEGQRHRDGEGDKEIVTYQDNGWYHEIC